MPLRLAVPQDLDLRPLVWGLDLPPWSDRVTLCFDEPVRMAALLGDGEVDAALVPVTALAEMDAEVEIVPGISRAASGPDPAVILVHDRPLRELESVAAPRRGHSAELLLRVLFAESGRELRIEDEHAGLEEALARRGGVLLFGDDALGAPAPQGARHFDLAAAWQALSGKPVVWSVWAARPGAIDRDTYALLHTARTRGRHDAALIAARLGPERGVAAERLLAALQTRAMYRLGTPQLEGLARLWEAAVGLGWLAQPPALSFLPLGEGSACHAKAEVLRALAARSKPRAGGFGDK